MGWEGIAEKKKSKAALLEQYTGEEKTILGIIAEKERASIDEIVLISGLGASKAASVLLKLEFEGVISGLPGKMYELRK